VASNCGPVNEVMYCEIWWTVANDILCA